MFIKHLDVNRKGNYGYPKWLMFIHENVLVKGVVFKWNVVVE